MQSAEFIEPKRVSRNFFAVDMKFQFFYAPLKPLLVPEYEKY